jgi:hypothetical protein
MAVTPLLSIDVETVNQEPERRSDEQHWKDLEEDPDGEVAHENGR